MEQWLRDSVSIPYGKGKAERFEGKSKNLIKYQFPMGKVKAHRNRLVFVLGIKYQFPMGKVKRKSSRLPIS